MVAQCPWLRMLLWCGRPGGGLRAPSGHPPATRRENPAGGGHGLLHAGGHHAGDLPNIHAAADGMARADYFTSDVTFAAGAANSLFDADGSSIIIHAKPDTYGENAGAGSRVACGVIVRN